MKTILDNACSTELTKRNITNFIRFFDDTLSKLYTGAQNPLDLHERFHVSNG